ncbi:hypothetical protein PtA15_10A711 [Puccinia triticina]|uniref:Uncharacterized protein n=1 Tax=Puccinia triticina TaxID=208348 RepID=A0ABY7CXW5_9BASI|nr:uncharacterized protein PtA15_10A711 [Puccinia triticina]WAQ89287.1 hypothetical protein PtA15_10A711 [Puccinia triticina]
MVLPRPSQILKSIVAFSDSPAASAANALSMTCSMVPCKSVLLLVPPMTLISSSALTGFPAKRNNRRTTLAPAVYPICTPNHQLPTPYLLVPSRFPCPPMPPITDSSNPPSPASPSSS